MTANSITTEQLARMLVAWYAAPWVPGMSLVKFLAAQLKALDPTFDEVEFFAQAGEPLMPEPEEFEVTE